MVSKAESKKAIIKRHKYIVIVACLALLLLVDLSPFGGNIRFYSKWAECGRKPVATRGGGLAGVKYYFEPSSLPGVHYARGYFCTPIEAERADYSATRDYFSFPHLRKERGLD